MKIRTQKLFVSELILLLYVFLIPIEDFFLQSILGSTSRIVAGVLIIYYVLTRKSINWALGSNFFYLYFLLAGISIILWAENPDYYSIFRLFMWMITTVIIANILYRNVSLISLVFKTYVLSCLYLAFVAIVNFNSNTGTDLQRVDVEGINQNLLASHFIICIVYLLYNYFKRIITFNTKILIVSLIFLFLLGIIASGSRSALLSVFISFLFFLPKNYRRFSTVFQVFIFVFIIFLFFKSENSFTQMLSDRVAASATDNGGNRLLIWQVALNAIIDNPILGVGYRNFPSEYGNYLASTSLSSLDFLKLGDSNRGAHNTPLETLSELGIVGFVFFYGFQNKLLRSLRLKKLNHSSLLIVMFIALNVNSLFGDLVNLKYFWLMVAIGFGLVSENHKFMESIHSNKLPSV